MFVFIYDCKINDYSIPHKSLHVIITSSRRSGGKGVYTEELAKLPEGNHMYTLDTQAAN